MAENPTMQGLFESVQCNPTNYGFCRALPITIGADTKISDNRL